MYFFGDNKVIFFSANNCVNGAIFICVACRIVFGVAESRCLNL